MIFKDYLKRDNAEVFLNLKEFAEWIELDGIVLVAQIQHFTQKVTGLNYRAFESQGDRLAQLHGDYLKVFFRTVDYCRKNERLPNQGEHCHVNKKRYRVLSSKDEMGIAYLLLADYRQEQLRQNSFQRTEIWGLDDG